MLVYRIFSINNFSKKDYVHNLFSYIRSRSPDLTAVHRYIATISKGHCDICSLNKNAHKINPLNHFILNSHIIYHGKSLKSANQQYALWRPKSYVILTLSCLNVGQNNIVGKTDFELNFRTMLYVCKNVSRIIK